HVPCQPTRLRPKAASDSQAVQHRVGHKPCHPAVSIQEGMNPKKAVVAAETAITLLNLPRGAVYASSKRFMDLCRSSSPVGGTCRADLDGLRANLPRRYMKPFTRVRVLDPKQFLRQAGAELSMKPADVVQRNRLGLCVLSRIALLLHFDVRHRFDLHISFLRFG